MYNIKIYIYNQPKKTNKISNITKIENEVFLKKKTLIITN